MLIVGIMTSPRKQGRSAALVDAALSGASQAGAECQRIDLIDHDIRQFRSQGGSVDGGENVPPELSSLMRQADGVVVTAPVYWGDINGIAKAFMDSVQYPYEAANGVPALGAAVAGGSGKGLLSGVQSIYHWFYHKQMRAFDPTPVSRFNMDEALATMQASGQDLAQMAAARKPFAGERTADRWADVVAHYARLPYLMDGPAQEFLMLARQLLKEAGAEAPENARVQFDLALAALERGDMAEAGSRAVDTYTILFH